METNNNVVKEEYICKICNKIYKNRDGLWKHNKKTHGNEYNICKSNVSNLDLQNDNLETNVSQMSVDVSLNSKGIYDDKIEGYSCDYCGTIYVHRQSKYKHQQKCKNKSVEEETPLEQKEIINLLMEQIKIQKEQLEQFKEQEKQNQEIKKTLMDLINKNCKVHPKTLQKINKQLNGDNNTINENINNGTINNNITYNIIGLGASFNKVKSLVA